MVNTPLVFNPFVPSYKKNPYLQLDRLRAGDPVHRSDALQAWIVTRYEDVLRVMRDPETFSSDARMAGRSPRRSPSSALTHRSATRGACSRAIRRSTRSSVRS